MLVKSVISVGKFSSCKCNTYVCNTTHICSLCIFLCQATHLCHDLSRLFDSCLEHIHMYNSGLKMCFLLFVCLFFIVLTSFLE